MRKIAVLSLAVFLAAAASAAETRKTEPIALEKGMRGVTLKVPLDQVQFVKKGDRADVLVTFDAVMANGKKEKVTATIMQNVGVLDVARNAGWGIIEILVNPNEAQYGILGVYQGELSIIRRAPDDRELKPMEMASFKKLFR